MGSVLCEHCTAACCRYLAIPLDKPTTARDYDDIRWYLLHEGVTIFVEEGDWYIQYQTACKHIGPDNRCMIYNIRPEICREYEFGECDYTGGDYTYDHLFTHAKQIEEHYERKTGKKLKPLAETVRPRQRKTRAATGNRAARANGAARANRAATVRERSAGRQPRAPGSSKQRQREKTT